jgi:two-component system, OmpR family, sensor histidine kinase KdpD
MAPTEPSQRSTPDLIRRRPLLPLARRIAGWLLAFAGAPALTVVLLGSREHLGLPSVLLLFLLLVVGVAAVGGTWPALVTAVGSFALVNWFFTPPYHTLDIQHGSNVIALSVYVAVAGVVSTLVSMAARRTRQALRARTEAELVASIALTMVGSHEPLTDLLGLLRTTFDLEAVALLRASSSAWRVVAHAGTPCPTTPAAADVAWELDDGAQLALVGNSADRVDPHLLDVFGAHLTTALRHETLRAEASEARALAQANELRAALLAGVSHDLRTPLSSIKASVTSLLQEEIDWPEEAVREFLETIDAEADRLNNVVGNLLDMNRLRTGSLRPTMRDVAVEEVVGRSLASLGDRARGITVDVPESLPFVRADPALLERSVANLLENAIKHGRGTPVAVAGAMEGDSVWIVVVDQGRGIPPDDRSRAFEPFERLGDTNPAGIGLGLAVARGFVDAMGGHLTLEDTPGGGLTARIDLPRAA